MLRYDALQFHGNLPILTENIALSKIFFYLCVNVHNGSYRISNKLPQCIKILFYYEAQHVSGDTSPIIRSQKLH